MSVIKETNINIITIIAMGIANLLNNINATLLIFFLTSFLNLFFTCSYIIIYLAPAYLK